MRYLGSMFVVLRHRSRTVPRQTIRTTHASLLVTYRAWWWCTRSFNGVVVTIQQNWIRPSSQYADTRL